MESVQMLSFLWSECSCIRTEFWKIRSRKNSVFGHFSRSETVKNNIKKDLQNGIIKKENKLIIYGIFCFFIWKLNFTVIEKLSHRPLLLTS